MNEMQKNIQNTGTTPMKEPEEITNNADGTSTAIFPDGTASDNTQVVRVFSEPNAQGMLLEQIANAPGGTSQVFITESAFLDKVGQFGAAFGFGNVASDLTSVDIKFSGINGTGNATSGTVDTTDGESFEFSLAGLPSGQLVSVDGFAGLNGTGKLDEMITLDSNGSIEIAMLNGNSDLPTGVIAMQEEFNTTGNLSTVRSQLANGSVVVERLNYNTDGIEVSQTVDTFNAQNQLVSSSTTAPTGPTPPQVGGQQVISQIVAALSSLAPPPLPGATAATVAAPQPQKITLAASAH